MSESIPIKDVLADVDHPMHADAKDLMGKLERGEISMCGCMGPMYGEPHCYCAMVRLGLPLSPERATKVAESNKRLGELFGPGGKYAKGDSQQ